MKFQFIFLFLLFGCLPLENQNKTTFFKSPVIYGSDDRKELSSIQDEHLKGLSDAVVSMISHKKENLNRPLCEGEAFALQSKKAICSGVLVGPDLILTAGHCLRNLGRCKDYYWTFDYKLNEEKEVRYECAYAIRPEGYYQNRSLDFLFVKLTKKVEKRTPITIGDLESLDKGDEVIAMGNPSGLPLKAMEGKVTEGLNDGIFKTDIDSFKGNSGAPVFSKKDGQFRGILISGEKDYEFDSLRNCYFSRKCTEGDCEGENVLNVSLMKGDLEKSLNKTEHALVSSYSSFKESCESSDINVESKYLLTLLQEKTRSQQCSEIEKRLKRAHFLDLNSSGLEDVSLLRFFDNLSNLNLENNKIKDIKFLKNYRNLKFLSVLGNPIEDVDSLKPLIGLERLSLSGELNFGFHLFKNLRSLRLEKSLEINKSFSSLKKLEELEIINSDLEDISFLEEMENIKNLTLKKNKIKDVSSLGLLTSLKFLDISFNSIADLSPLNSLEKLYVFKGDHNPLEVCPKNEGPLAIKNFCKNY
ncbi:MAG: trypsin-like peptidase domain-containing protein [Bdellovibrionota bacterium]|nr:trypsin-like peptidase domain-containing protein [Bdellovibrionota bacterium]